MVSSKSRNSLFLNLQIPWHSSIPCAFRERFPVPLAGRVLRARHHHTYAVQSTGTLDDCPLLVRSASAMQRTSGSGDARARISSHPACMSPVLRQDTRHPKRYKESISLRPAFVFLLSFGLIRYLSGDWRFFTPDARRRIQRKTIRHLAQLAFDMCV